MQCKLERELCSRGSRQGHPCCMYRAHVLRVKSDGGACVTVLDPSPTPLRTCLVSDRPPSESAEKTEPTVTPTVTLACSEPAAVTPPIKWVAKQKEPYEARVRSKKRTIKARQKNFEVNPVPVYSVKASCRMMPTQARVKRTTRTVRRMSAQQVRCG